MRWPVPSATVLTGTTVQLSALDTAADSAALHQALDHDVVWAHVPGRPRSVGHCAQTWHERCARPDWHPWVVRTRRPVGGMSAGAVVGTTSYLDVHPRDAWLEIGFTLYCPPVWRSAVNPETKLLLLGYAFDTLQAGRVQLKTDVRNHRSQQAIAYLGARYEGTLRRQMRRDDGTVRDSVLFSVIAEDWPAVRSRLRDRIAAIG